jgi:D-3-phosphoglycerate dehydrogenase
MKILVCDPVGEDGLTSLKEKGYDVLFTPDITPEELLEKVKDVDALIVRGRTKVTSEVIQKGQSLQVIARSGTGVDTIDCVAAKERGIKVVNAPGANAQSVAEHTFAFILALTRQLVPTVNTLRAGRWAKSDFRGMELLGKTLGVIGVGHIGKRVAQIGEALGMKVLVYSRKPASIGTSVSLSELFSKSDIVSIHVPLTDETRGLVGTNELHMMKPTAFLINTSRGAVVDEVALIDVLKNKKIAGAALDVFTNEPLSEKSELLTLDTVLVTPHVGADSHEGENRASVMIAEDIDLVLTGQKPKREVIL